MDDSAATCYCCVHLSTCKTVICVILPLHSTCVSLKLQLFACWWLTLNCDWTGQRLT